MDGVRDRGIEFVSLRKSPKVTTPTESKLVFHVSGAVGVSRSTLYRHLKPDGRQGSQQQTAPRDRAFYGASLNVQISHLGTVTTGN